MSEPAAQFRQPIDLEEFERRLRVGAPPTKPDSDPLAELARLVGQDDPFKGAVGDPARLRVPRERTGQQGRVQVSHLTQVHPPLDHAAAPEAQPRSSSPIPPAGAHREPTFELPAQSPAEAASDHSDSSTLGLRGAILDDARPSHEANEITEEDGLTAGEYFDPAEGEEASAPLLPPHIFADAPQPRRSARGVMVLMGVLAVGAAGFWGALHFRQGGAATASGNAPPVILAGGPTKVQPTDANAGQDAVQGASVLDKKAPSGSEQAKVVSNEEQPVDLSQAGGASASAVNGASAAGANQPPPPAQPADGAVNASLAAPAANGLGSAVAAGQPNPTPAALGSGFPEPRKVKVVSVRPDGSIVADAGDPATTGSLPWAPVAPSSPAPDTGTAPAGGDTGKSTERAPSAPPATPPANAQAPSDQTQPPPTPAPKARHKVSKPAAKPKETTEADAAQSKGTQVADAAGTDTEATGSTGGFAVQLAAAPNEHDARDTLQRLQKKYATELGPHRTTFHRVKVGDKVVYRVRVSNLTHEEAAALCAKLKSNGGDCFVANQN